MFLIVILNIFCLHLTNGLIIINIYMVWNIDRKDAVIC